MNTKVTIAVGLLLLAGGTGIYQYIASAHSSAEDEPDVYTVTRQNLVVTVSASGEAEPYFRVELKSKASGEIISFPYEPGDKLTTETEALRLDPKTEERNLAQREADLVSARATRQSAEANLIEQTAKKKRAEKLWHRKVFSEQDYETARAQFLKADAQVMEAGAGVKKAEIARDDARDRLEETVIFSPITGTLLEKSVQKGQIIASGISSISGGTKLGVVADLSRIFVMALVDETDIGRLKVGQLAHISVDTYPDKIFNGQVTRIYPQGEVVSAITIFRVLIEAEGDDRSLLWPKMSANVEIVVDQSDNVLTIPSEAIRYRKDGSVWVWVDGFGGPEKRTISIGLDNGYQTAVTSGLQKGERLVLQTAAPQQ